MVLLKSGIRSVFLVLVLFALIQAVSAWEVQNLAISSPQDPIAPKTPVTITYTVHFSPVYSGLTTFVNDDTLDMYTDLSDATWDVTKTEVFEDRPSETTKLVENKKGIRVRIDGWELSFGRRQFDLSVRLTGNAPDVAQSQSKTMIRVQELDPSANPVPGRGMVKKYTIATPTPTPPPATPEPTTAVTSLSPAGTLQDQNTPPVTTPPAKKPTYSPGPGPGLTAGLLVLLCVAAAVKGKNKQ
jgi:hypothetical protein